MFIFALSVVGIAVGAFEKNVDFVVGCAGFAMAMLSRIELHDYVYRGEKP